MNTSGPSSRPRKPYPLALLNHLTVPFKRSTCAPLFFLRIPLKRRDSRGAQKMCRHCAADRGDCQGSASRSRIIATRLWRRGLPRLRRESQKYQAFLPPWSLHLGQPQDAGDGLGIADAAIERHPFRLRQGKKFRCDPLVRLGLRFAGLEPPGQADGHGFVEKAWADVEMQDSLPMSGPVAGLLEHLALGCCKRGFAIVDASSWQLPHHRLCGVPILAFEQDARLGFVASFRRAIGGWIIGG